jgi:hypothetical protein
LTRRGTGWRGLHIGEEWREEEMGRRCRMTRRMAREGLRVSHHNADASADGTRWLTCTEAPLRWRLKRGVKDGGLRTLPGGTGSMRPLRLLLPAPPASPLVGWLRLWSAGGRKRVCRPQKRARGRRVGCFLHASVPKAVCGVFRGGK